MFLSECACIVLRLFLFLCRGGLVVLWCWVNFQRRGVLHVLIWILVGQGPTALAVDADGGSLFSLETARYRKKFRLKGPLNQKQPTNLVSLR